MRGADFVFMLLAHAAFFRLGIGIAGWQLLFRLRTTAFGHGLPISCIQGFHRRSGGRFYFTFAVRDQADMMQVVLAMPDIQGNGFLHLHRPFGRRMVVSALEVLRGQ